MQDTRKVFLFIVVVAFTAPPGCSGRLVDLTHPLDENAIGFPGFKPFHLEINQRGYTEEGFWFQAEEYSGATHTGTHFDAPCHIVPGQWHLDEIPLDRFMAPAAVVDISERALYDWDANLEIKDLLDWERRHNRTLDGMIVLVNSGWGKRWHSREAFLGTTCPDDKRQLHFPSVSSAAAEWVARNRMIYGLGIDTTGLDSAQEMIPKAHQALFRVNIYGLENVANLDKLPEYGAYAYVFPLKITYACGSPVRVVAFVPE